MFQHTLMRIKDIDAYPPIVVTNEDHKFFVKNIVNNLGIEATILIEPVSKNTALL